MNKFTIEIGGNQSDVVEAHKCLIMHNGQLKFVNVQGNLIKAYNADAWYTCEQTFQEPTPIQLGTPLFIDSQSSNDTDSN